MFQLNRAVLHCCIQNLTNHQEANKDQLLHVQNRRNTPNQALTICCDCHDGALGAFRPQDAILRFEEGTNWCIEEDNEPFNICCDILHDCQVRAI